MLDFPVSGQVPLVGVQGGVPQSSPFVIKFPTRPIPRPTGRCRYGSRCTTPLRPLRQPL